MKAGKFFRRHAYRWHRLTSMIIALPLMLWTVSGFLHPVMSYFKPEVANAFPADTIDLSATRIPPAAALERQGIDSFRQLRIVKIGQDEFYQVRTTENEIPVYLATSDGQLLPDGDAVYAADLARRYLRARPSGKGGHAMHEGGSGFSMLGDQGTPAKKATKELRPHRIERLSTFGGEYRSSNKYLPVYRVAFPRADGIRLYIETGTGKLALAMDNNRSWYVRFFAWAHSWSFLDGAGPVRNIAIALLSLLCLINGMLGLYVYNLMRKKKPKGDAPRRLHRVLGNSLVVFVLLFAVTGAWHSLQKMDRPETVQAGPAFAREEAVIPPGAREKTTGFSFAQIDGRGYWRLTPARNEGPAQRYVDARSGDTLARGEERHAQSLLRHLQPGAGAPGRIVRLTRFNDRYPMSQKRLPVMELECGRKRFYVETATGTLAATGKEAADRERKAFSTLHMQHFWEDLLGKPYGKDAGNGILIAVTLGLMLLALSGFVIYGARQVRRRSKT